MEKEVKKVFSPHTASRGGSRAAATSKMERFVIIVNGWKPLTIITKRSILDVAAALDPPLASSQKKLSSYLASPEQGIRLIKCNQSLYEVYVNFIKTDTFSSTANRKSFKINIVVIVNAKYIFSRVISVRSNM